MMTSYVLSLFWYNWILFTIATHAYFLSSSVSKRQITNVLECILYVVSLFLVDVKNYFTIDIKAYFLVVKCVGMTRIKGTQMNSVCGGPSSTRLLF